MTVHLAPPSIALQWGRPGTSEPGEYKASSSAAGYSITLGGGAWDMEMKIVIRDSSGMDQFIVYGPGNPTTGEDVMMLEPWLTPASDYCDTGSNQG